MENETSKINLVTGATGLLGSHIVEQLCMRGHPVRALVRRGSDVSWLKSQPVELAQGDVTEPETLSKAMQGVAVVFHAAARVGDWGPWSEFQSITIDGTRNMVEAAVAAGVRRFVHISSISAYGHVNGEGLVLDESAPLGRELGRWSYYSRAKVAAEEVVWAAHGSGRLDVTVIRPSWLYGPRDRATMGRIVDAIRRRKTKLIGDGTNRLSVAHAANVAEAAVLAADTPAASGEAYNCSNDGVITQAEYFNAIAAALGERPVTRKVPYAVVKSIAFTLELIGHALRLKRPPLVTRYSAWLIGRRCFYETHKAREQLGWTPRISYEQGIPATVDWYLRECEQSSAPAAVSAAAVSS